MDFLVNLILKLDFLAGSKTTSLKNPNFIVTPETIFPDNTHPTPLPHLINNSLNKTVEQNSKPIVRHYVTLLRALPTSSFLLMCKHLCFHAMLIFMKILSVRALGNIQQQKNL